MRDDQTCAYCTFPADGYDHLVPVSRQTTRRRKGKMASVSERVPCCELCNSLLGPCPAFKIRDRAAFLILRYAERPRSEARETWLKLRRLLTIVAGYELEAELEAIDERQERRIAAIAEAERLRVRQAFEQERLAEEAATEAARVRAETALTKAEEVRLRRERQPKVRRGNWPCQPYSMLFETRKPRRRFRIRRHGKLWQVEAAVYVADLEQRARQSSKRLKGWFRSQ